MENDLHDPSRSFVARIIDWSVANRFFVLLGALVLLVAGIIAVNKTPLDAIPDLTETQVIIRTEWPGQAPQIIEDQVTYLPDRRPRCRRHPAHRAADGGWDGVDDHPDAAAGACRLRHLYAAQQIGQGVQPCQINTFWSRVP